MVEGPNAAKALPNVPTDLMNTQANYQPIASLTGASLRQ